MNDLLCVHVVVKFGNFTLSFGRLRHRNVLKCMLAAREALLFLIQPIISLFSGVVVACCRRNCLNTLLSLRDRLLARPQEQ